MATRLEEIQRKKWARQPNDEMCTRARQPIDILCMGVGRFSIEDLHVGIRELQLGVRHLQLEHNCVGPRGWMLFIGVRQLSMDK